MKKSITTAILFLFVLTAVCQNVETPKYAQVSLRKTTFSSSKQVSDILSSLYLMSQSYIEHWSSRTDIISTTIEGKNNDQTIKVTHNGAVFTEAQKSIFENSELGQEVLLTIAYKEKDLLTNEFGDVIYMRLGISVMPDVEALYPGGLTQVVDYLRGNVTKNLPAEDSTSIYEKMKVAEVKFTVDETGKVINAQISKSSNDESIDKLLLEATSKMPAWKPAMTIKGEKVKRQFTVSVDKRKMTGC